MNKVTILCGDPSKIDCSIQQFDAPFPERTHLHPKLQIEYAEIFIFNASTSNIRWNIIVTNSDHIINRLRVAKKNKEIDELIIEFHPFESDKVITIEVDKNGTCSKYPIGFLDEWGNQLMKLI